MSEICKSCGKKWVDHPGIQFVCKENQKLKQMKKIELGEYTITEHPDLPDGRKVIWIVNGEGEGMTIDIETLDKVWEEYF